MSQLKLGSLAFAGLGAAALAVAAVQLTSSAAAGSLCVYPPLAFLQIATTIGACAPLLVLSRRFRREITRPETTPGPMAQRLLTHLLTCWLWAFAGTLGVVPGLFLIGSERAVVVLVIALGLVCPLLWVLGDRRRAIHGAWVAVSLFGVCPTLFNAAFQFLV